MGPIWALLMKFLGASLVSAIDGCGCVNAPAGSSVCGPPIFPRRGVGTGCAFRGFSPRGRRFRRIPFFELGLECRLFLGADSVPKSSDVRFDFPEGAPSIGNEGTGVYNCTDVRRIGVPEWIPIGPEGVLVCYRAVFSEVVESAAVCISWDF